MFDLTTGQWIFCSVFAGVCTVMYMIDLYKKEEMIKQRQEEIEVENFAEFLKFLTDLSNETHENEEELEEGDKEGEQEKNED